MRLGSAALVVIGISACGKGADRSPPAPAPSATAAVPASPPPVPQLPAAVVVAQVGRDGFPDAVHAGPLVIVSSLAVVVEGNPLAPMRDGAVDPAQLADAPGGRHLPGLVAWAKAWQALPVARGAVVALAVDPDLAVEPALQVIASFAAMGQRDFAFLVRGVEGVGALPVRSVDGPAELTLALGATRAVLATSAAGDAPAATIADLTVARGDAWTTPARQALTEAIDRRAAAAPRPAIVIEVEPTCPMATLAAAVAAVRHDASGKPLVADVRLALRPPTAVAVAAAPSASASATPSPSTGSIVAALSDQEAAKFADLLTASGDSDIADMARRRPGADLAAQIDAVRDEGVKVAVGGGGSGHGAAALGGVGGGDLLTSGGPGAPPAPAGPSPQISITGKTQLTDSSLTAEVVARKVAMAYLSGLKRCYAEVLKVDPAQRGAASLSLTVSESGRVASAKVSTTIASPLAACVEHAALAWRFPPPLDADGEPTLAELRLELALAPR